MSVCIDLIYDNYRKELEGWSGLAFGTMYGEEGSGYTFCSFEIPLSEVDGPPLLGNDITVTLYISTVLFFGTIRETEEISEEGRDLVRIIAGGYLMAAEDDEFLRAFCNTDSSRWKVPSELPGLTFRPDLFTSGTYNRGLYLHANNDAVIASGQYTHTEFEFFDGEVAKRLRTNLSINLGRGIIFDGTVASVSGADLVYANDSGEALVRANMVIYNASKEQSATIQSINTSTNTITVTEATAISSWDTPDEIVVAGPLFWAGVSDISSDTITYTEDVGEDNLAAGELLQNMTNKQVAEIASFSAISNTITVTDENAIVDWGEGDLIALCTSLFYAEVASVASDGDGSGTITYSSPRGERVVDGQTGFVLYNETRDEFATVDAWSIGTNQVGVATYSEVSAWSASDVLRIYAPMRAWVRDSVGAQLWPASDWREGAIKQNARAVDVTTSGSPTKFMVRLESYLPGKFDESAFVTCGNLRAYSDDVPIIDATFIARKVIELLSTSAHGWDSSTWDVWATLEWCTVISSFFVSSVVDQVITYGSSVNEDLVSPGDMVWNHTWGTSTSEAALITAIDTGTNTITIHDDYDISTWGANDDLWVLHVLEPAVFEHITPREVMNWACKFGTGLGHRLAWGLLLNERNTFFIEDMQDPDEPVGYGRDIELILRPGPGVNIAVSRSLNESQQVLRGSYTDQLGETALTDWITDEDAYFAGKYRRATINLSNVDDVSTAEALIAQLLLESKYPAERASYTAVQGSIRSISGSEVPIETIQATGQLVAIESKQGFNKGRSDERNFVAVFQLAGVEVDYENRSVTLIPAAPRQDFTRMIALLEAGAK